MNMEQLKDLIHVNQFTGWLGQNKYLEKIKDGNNVMPAAAVAGATLIVYLSIVRYYRYKNLEHIIKRYPNPQDIFEDAEAAQEVFSITVKREFPFMATEGTEMALFKTYTIPTISKILVSTGEFATNCGRRAEDTGLILNEMIDTHARIQNQLKLDPNTPKKDIKEQWERPKEAVTRLNEIHGHYNILNEDYIYTLSLFIFEPISWINRYDWRQLDKREINAIFRVWYDVGVAMKIKDIPDTVEKMYEFKEKYAAEKIRYAGTNWKCGEPTLRHLTTKLPPFLRQEGYKFMLRLLPSVLDPKDVSGFQLPYPESKFITLAVRSILAIRAYIVRYAMLPRSFYSNRTPFYPNSEGRYVPEFFRYKPHIYKDGYIIAQLGPEKFLNSSGCPFNKK